MQKYITIGIVSLLIFLLLSCSTMRRHWQNVKARDTIVGYELFLELYPDTKYSDEARERLENRRWDFTKSVDEIAAYRDFLEKHPDSEHADEARERLHDLEWQQVVEMNTINAYEEFISRYPETENRPAAEQALEKLYWQRAITRHTRADYRKFLQKYPNAENAPRAQRGLKLLNLELADSLTTLQLQVHQQMEEGASLRLPVEQIVRDIFRGSSVRIITEAEDNYTAQLKINLTGTAPPQYFEYFSLDQQSNKVAAKKQIIPLFTNAAISGEITFSFPNFSVTKLFSGKADFKPEIALEPESAENRRTTGRKEAAGEERLRQIEKTFAEPTQHLFEPALTDSGSLVQKVLETAVEVYGPQILISALKNNNSGIRYWAAKSLYRHSGEEALASGNSPQNKPAPKQEESSTENELQANSPLLRPVLNIDRQKAEEALTVEVSGTSAGKEPPASTMLRPITAPGINFLVQSLDFSQRAVRRHAAALLAESGGEETIPYLIDALEKEQDETVKQELLNALQKITGENYGQTAEEWRQGLREK
ncbi:MAG: HEAT repeat domain-containing protein [Calditrichia bacterium]